MAAIRFDSIVQTCSGFPSQWDAVTNYGNVVYIRLRHGDFTIDIDGKERYRGNPSGFGGIMSTEEMISYVNSLFGWSVGGQFQSADKEG